jgi:Putative MetA-pathway of phenol degradation
VATMAINHDSYMVSLQYGQWLMRWGLAAALAGFFSIGFGLGAQAQDTSAQERRAGQRDPKTLFEWVPDGESKENGKEQTNDEEDRVDPDRPHFPEASNTVGKGRIVLESGYTFAKKGETFVLHSYPEALLRAGVFADWFEFRIGQNLADQRQTNEDVTTTASGAQDLYLGMKLGLTEQKGILPQIAVIPQMTLPTGSSTLTAHRILPGVNIDLAWQVVKDLFGIEFLLSNNFVQDETQNTGFQVATGLTGTFQLTKNLEAFAEWDAFYPTGAITSSGPQHYAIGGLVYFVTPNFAVDARAGVGLNSRSNNFLAGVGFAARY